MAEGSTTARVKENGESAFSVDIEVSGHRLQGDEPPAMGGKDLGPAPYDLLAAALAECTAMTVRWYARQQDWPLEKVEVKLTHEKETVEGQRGKTDVFSKLITVTGDALTEEQRNKLIEVAAKCPVQRTLEGTPRIVTICPE